MIHGGRYDLQLQTQVIDVSCLHNFPVAIWLPSSWLGYVALSLDLSDDIRAEDYCLTQHDPVEWGSTTTSIECFKRCHSHALLVTIVV
jgi:hypothetical protein